MEEDEEELLKKYRVEGKETCRTATRFSLTTSTNCMRSSVSLHVSRALSRLLPTIYLTLVFSTAPASSPRRSGIEKYQVWNRMSCGSLKETFPPLISQCVCGRTITREKWAVKGIKRSRCQNVALTLSSVTQQQLFFFSSCCLLFSCLTELHTYIKVGREKQQQQESLLEATTMRRKESCCRSRKLSFFPQDCLNWRDFSKSTTS